LVFVNHKIVLWNGKKIFVNHKVVIVYFYTSMYKSIHQCTGLYTNDGQHLLLTPRIVRCRRLVGEDPTDDGHTTPAGLTQDA